MTDTAPPQPSPYHDDDHALPQTLASEACGDAIGIPKIPVTPGNAATLPARRFFNREFSWLAFNERVLAEARNEAHPLLERLKFLAISDSNLEEFYAVRVAGLIGKHEAGIEKRSIDGLTPLEQLQQISTRAKQLIKVQQEIWAQLRQEMQHEHIAFIHHHDLKPDDLDWLGDYFQKQLFAALTPMAVDPAHPFPFIPHDGFVMVLKLRKPKKNDVFWALLPIPKMLSRFIALKQSKRNDPQRFITIEDVIPLFFDQLFPGFDVLSHGIVHLIRDSELDIDEDVDDLVQMYQEALKLRRQGNVIRLVVQGNVSDDMLDFLLTELEIDKNDVFTAEHLINLSDLHQLRHFDFPEHLSFKRYSPKLSPHFTFSKGAAHDYFAVIKKRDILLHHPYESFDTVIDFLRQAARDPDVIAIKQTLYRSPKNSLITKALIEAAYAGKAVTAVVELKARFDEETNIHIANDLENAGVNVVYGVIGLKTHAKMTLVVRKEAEGLVKYCHFGTGNYHPITAKLYTDVSLFTADAALCDDATRVFNYITGYGVPKKLQNLSISPTGLMDKLYHLIEAEIQHANEGRPGEIWAKMNSLVDPTMIDALYRASQAGIKVHLVIRGICCLKPGIPGLSDNITVTSIVGRFLEHARVICFGQGSALPNPQARVFISSADWMPRNFYKRVETLVEINDPIIQHQLMNELMASNLRDNRQSWTLQADGRYEKTRHQNTQDTGHFSAQHYFMEHPHLPENKKLHSLPAKKAGGKNPTPKKPPKP